MCLARIPASAVGSEFVDYIVTDRVITPPETKVDYSERFLYVPPAFGLYYGSWGAVQVTADRKGC